MQKRIKTRAWNGLIQDIINWLKIALVSRYSNYSNSTYSVVCLQKNYSRLGALEPYVTHHKFLKMNNYFLRKIRFYVAQESHKNVKACMFSRARYMYSFFSLE